VVEPEVGAGVLLAGSVVGGRAVAVAGASVAAGSVEPGVGAGVLLAGSAVGGIAVELDGGAASRGDAVAVT